MAKIRGARIWWAPSTTATSLAVIGALAVLLPARAPAGGGVERLVRDVRAASGPHLPTLEEVTGRCASDTLCAAQVLAQAIGPRARIEDVRHPSTDQIRWVTSARSVASASVDEAILTIRLIRFGRKAVPEIRNELETRLTADSEIKTVVLDLRANQGGDLDRMLRVAATFTGPVQNAVRLIGWNGATALSIPRTDPVFRSLSLRVLVGPETASSAEVLAALLKVHAGAQIIGSATLGKNYVLRVVPVNHDVRLLVPGERIEVPGAVLAGGLVPDVMVTQ